MNKIIAGLVMATTLTIASAALAQRNAQQQQNATAANQPSSAVSPEVSTDGKATFRQFAPKASEVILNGDWPQGSNIGLIKDDSGTGSVTVGPLPPPPRPADLSLARRAQVCAGIAIWSLLVFVDCNGALDRSVIPTQTNIVTTEAGESRGGESYSLIAKSWRPGVATETLSVDYQTYEEALTNQTVTVDVHRFFGWPWYSNVNREVVRGLRSTQFPKDSKSWGVALPSI
jgi:hypothetical protein